jgi:hypothetical protein
MADVFISYSKIRHAETVQLAGELEELGYSVWWDTSLLPTGSFATASLGAEFFSFGSRRGHLRSSFLFRPL